MHSVATGRYSTSSYTIAIANNAEYEIVANSHLHRELRISHQKITDEDNARDQFYVWCRWSVFDLMTSLVSWRIQDWRGKIRKDSLRFSKDSGEGCTRFSSVADPLKSNTCWWVSQYSLWVFYKHFKCVAILPKCVLWLLKRCHGTPLKFYSTLQGKNHWKCMCALLRFKQSVIINNQACSSLSNIK